MEELKSFATINGAYRKKLKEAKDFNLYKSKLKTLVDNGPAYYDLSKAWHQIGYKIIVHEKQVLLREKEPPVVVEPMNEIEEMVLEETAEVIEEIGGIVLEGEDGIMVEGGNMTNSTVNGTNITLDGNLTLNGSEGNLTINTTELEGPIDGTVEEKEYDGGGHHVEQMSLDELGEKDNTIEEIEEELIDMGKAVDPETGELIEGGTGNETLTNSTDPVEPDGAPSEDEEGEMEEDEEVIRPI